MLAFNLLTGIGLNLNAMSPLVSIVIPTFDRPTYLEEAVLSALGQTYANIEVLVGDNGGGEAKQRLSPEIVADPRFSHRQNSHNLGMSGNFNALAEAARGEFLVAMGDDDRLLPDFISRLVEEMKPDVSLAFCNHYLMDGQGKRLEAESREQTRRYHRDGLTSGALASAQIAAWEQAIALSAAMMRTADMRRLRFRDDLNTPDAEFFIRLAQEGAKFVFVADYLVEYRVHVAATTTSGHCNERLVELLLPVAVTPAVEPYKKKLLGPLMMNAVSRCLQRGERDRAKRFLHSRYYPSRAPVDRHSSSAAKRLAEAAEHAVKFGLQHFCASLPTTIGCPTYRVMRAAKDWVRS
ncbi:MAG: glycosyltransferase family 2 protein [Chthoniobacterales bacterium]|nr:glycosyltransferase family 2 protein [Chthoniobacterales bacterium]